MRYLSSILRIFVLVAVVLAVANFSDVQKTRAAGCPNPITTSIAIPADCENQDVVIQGNITVTTSGQRHFKSVIIDGATVITDALAVTSNSINDEPDKKVDWIIDNELILRSGGKINVNGKGYQGIDGDGKGPAAGKENAKTLTGGYYVGGGGGLGGPGYKGTFPKDADGGSYSGVNQSTIDRGSGGGRGYVQSNSKKGGAGGGLIKVTAKIIAIDQSSGSLISANGLNNNPDPSGYGSGGGGAGGDIQLTATDGFSSNYTSITTGPNVNGGNNNFNNNQGLINITPNEKYQGIEAKGGDATPTHGGQGGGGIINLNFNLANTSCHIFFGDTIPNTCENKDVTVSGTTINMNKVQVDGDSKRTFKNLTVENGGVITHEALTRADINSDGKTVDRTSGAGRLKKVDIDVGTGTITLKTGGKIDVTGKGYPGAYFSWGTAGDYSTYDGCNGSDMGYLVGANGISTLGNTTNETTGLRVNYGFGPGGGIAYNEYNYFSGGGGSFAGLGKEGNSGGHNHTLADEIIISGSRTYNYLNGSNLDWGSGGGAASHNGPDINSTGFDVSCANGGEGGGIIDLKADTLDMSNVGTSSNPVINASGNQGLMFQDDGNSVGSGGGSGGVIRLNSNEIIINSLTAISVNPGINSHGNPPFDEAKGKIIGSIPAGTPYRISAKGGDRSEDNVPGYGSGGGGGWIVFGAGPTTGPSIQSKKVTVTVTWQEGTQQKTIKLYDVLRSDVTP